MKTRRPKRSCTSTKSSTSSSARRRILTNSVMDEISAAERIRLRTKQQRRKREQLKKKKVKTLKCESATMDDQKQKETSTLFGINSIIRPWIEEGRSDKDNRSEGSSSIDGEPMSGDDYGIASSVDGEPMSDKDVGGASKEEEDEVDSIDGESMIKPTPSRKPQQNSTLQTSPEVRGHSKKGGHGCESGIHDHIPSSIELKESRQQGWDENTEGHSQSSSACSEIIHDKNKRTIQSSSSLPIGISVSSQASSEASNSTQAFIANHDADVKSKKASTKINKHNYAGKAESDASIETDENGNSDDTFAACQADNKMSKQRSLKSGPTTPPANDATIVLSKKSEKKDTETMNSSHEKVPKRTPVILRAKGNMSVSRGSKNGSSTAITSVESKGDFKNKEKELSQLESYSPIINESIIETSGHKLSKPTEHSGKLNRVLSAKDTIGTAKSDAATTSNALISERSEESDIQSVSSTRSKESSRPIRRKATSRLANSKPHPLPVGRVACPICNKLFDALDIEEHASQCGLSRRSSQDVHSSARAPARGNHQNPCSVAPSRQKSSRISNLPHRDISTTSRPITSTPSVAVSAAKGTKAATVSKPISHILFSGNDTSTSLSHKVPAAHKSHTEIDGLLGKSKELPKSQLGTDLGAVVRSEPFHLAGFSSNQSTTSSNTTQPLASNVNDLKPSSANPNLTSIPSHEMTVHLDNNRDTSKKRQYDNQTQTFFFNKKRKIETLAAGWIEENDLNKDGMDLEMYSMSLSSQDQVLNNQALIDKDTIHTAMTENSRLNRKIKKYRNFQMKVNEATFNKHVMLSDIQIQGAFPSMVINSGNGNKRKFWAHGQETYSMNRIISISTKPHASVSEGRKFLELLRNTALKVYDVSRSRDISTTLPMFSANTVLNVLTHIKEFRSGKLSIFQVMKRVKKEIHDLTSSLAKEESASMAEKLCQKFETFLPLHYKMKNVLIESPVKSLDLCSSLSVRTHNSILWESNRDSNRWKRQCKPNRTLLNSTANKKNSDANMSLKKQVVLRPQMEKVLIPKSPNQGSTYPENVDKSMAIFNVAPVGNSLNVQRNIVSMPAGQDKNPSVSASAKSPFISVPSTKETTPQPQTELFLTRQTYAPLHSSAEESKKNQMLNDEFREPKRFPSQFPYVSTNKGNIHDLNYSLNVTNHEGTVNREKAPLNKDNIPSQKSSYLPGNPSKTYPVHSPHGESKSKPVICSFQNQKHSLSGVGWNNTKQINTSSVQENISHRPPINPITKPQFSSIQSYQVNANNKNKFMLNKMTNSLPQPPSISTSKILTDDTAGHFSQHGTQFDKDRSGQKITSQSEMPSQSVCGNGVATIVEPKKKSFDKVTNEVGVNNLVKTKSNTAIDLNQAKRPEKPKNPYTHFCREVKPRISSDLKRKNPNLHLDEVKAQVQSEALTRWRSLTNEQREIYRRKSKEDHERYDRELRKIR